MTSERHTIDLVSLADCRWLSFPAEWYKGTRFTLWQAIAWVMMEEGISDPVIAEYWDTLRDFEEGTLDEVLEEESLYTLTGSEIEYAELQSYLDLGLNQVFLRANTANEYFELLDQNRHWAVAQMTLPNLVYCVLLAEIERFLAGESTELKIVAPSSGSVSVSDAIAHGLRISKASLKKWKQLPSVVDLGLVDMLLKQPKNRVRKDKIENEQKITGMLVYLIGELLPANVKKGTGKVNISALTDIIELNVDRTSEEFPKKRSIHETLTISYRWVKHCIRNNSPLVVSEGPINLKVLAEPLALKTKNVPKGSGG